MEPGMARRLSGGHFNLRHQRSTVRTEQLPISLESSF
jgi:hypothetical protein